MGSLNIQTNEYDDDLDLIDLYENAPCGYLSLSPVGSVLRINQTFCTFLEKKKSEVEQARYFQDFLSAASCLLFEDQFLTQEEMVLEIESPRGKAHIFNIKLKKVNDSYGQLKLVRLTLLDITEQKKWCEKLKTTSTFGIKVSNSLDYEETLNNILEMICSQLADGCLIDVFRNQSLMRVGEEHNIIDKKIVMMSILKGQLVIDAVLENKIVLLNNMDDPGLNALYEDEIQFLKKCDIQSLLIIPLVLSGRKIGAISFVNTESNKIFHEDRVTLLKGLCTHISSSLERSRLHESVAVEAKNRYDLISLASHKIRTPLTSLKLQLQASLKKIAASDATTMKRAEVERFLDRINLYMNTITESVDKMIDLNEINQKIVLHKERINLREMVFEVQRSMIPLFNEAKCDVSLWADTDVWPMVDSARLKKVIAQIFTNAMRLGRGRPISITLTRVPGHAVLHVKDCGPSDANGLGSIETESLRLEMRLSTTIIEEHGGFVEVEVDKDGGNSLSMYLPA